MGFTPTEGPDAAKSRPCPRNLVLIGFMGCGKSTIGRHLARSCSMKFLDLDDLIVEQADGRSIPDIFSLEGESGFRARETTALRSLAGHEGLVIATGGGVVSREQNLELLRRLGLVVWLDADMDDMWQRISGNRSRPMLHVEDPRGEAERLWNERRPRYRDTAHLVIETGGLSSDEVACGVSSSAALHFARQDTRPAPCHPDGSRDPG